MRTLGLVVVLGLSACTAVNPSASPGRLPSSATGPLVDIEQARPCLPPGIPALSTLVQIGQRPGIAPEAGTGQSIRVRSVLYASDATSAKPAYVVYYATTPDGERIASVDDHPLAPIPEWVDTGIVNEIGELRPDRHASCQWARLVPREHP